MKETLHDLKTRRSCRAYTEKQVDKDTLFAILEAGTYAPTGRGKQSPRIVAVQDKKTRDILSRLNAQAGGYTTDPFYGAPTVVAVLADSTVPTHLYDGALVMGNLLNAAWAQGVDSCYIFRAKEVFAGEEGKALLSAWGMDERYVGIGFCVLGYGKQEGKQPAATRKKDYITYV